MGRSKKVLAPGDAKEDLILLPTISEELVLANIKDRYTRNQIFTRIGAQTLLVVNPVKTLESFSDLASKEYADWAKDTHEEKMPLPAHIFDMAASVFYHMLRNQQDQSVVFWYVFDFGGNFFKLNDELNVVLLFISGESGSGKTEARRLFVRQLIALSRNAKKKSKVHSGVMKTETVLDAFGTARTATNPHSSRFGRYTEFQYDDRGKMVGAKMLDYLLEKNRVSHMPADERNFNIFYYLLAGATPEERTQWRLHDPSHYHYLNTSRYSRVTMEDQIKLGELRDHMKSLGIGRRLQAQIYQVMAAILHLGNVEFQDDPEKPQEACTVKTREALEIAAELLGVAATNLETTLTVRTKLVYRDVVSVFLNAQDAAAQRDSLATNMYSLVFSWLIEHINARLCQEDCATFVGVADLMGFQNSQVNSLEQLLANFANERLQNFMSRRVLEAHEEYVREGVRSASVPQNDNTATVDFLAGDNGLLSIIDRASADTEKRPVMDHLNQKLGENPLFIKSDSLAAFRVKHYAQTVEYDTTDLVEKNRDTLCPDFVSIFRGNGKNIPSSANGYIRDLFSERVVSTERDGRDGRMVTGAHGPKKPMRTPSLKRRQGRFGEKTAPPTVAYNFRTAIDEMIDTLSETIPWFVLCIKPNEEIASDKYESKKVKAQLRGLNVLQIAQAKAAADYTASYTVNEFLQRYRVIVDPMNLDESAGPSGKCEDFILQSNWTTRNMAVGRTRVFLSESSWRSLEDELRAIEEQLKAERRARGRTDSRDGSGKRGSSTGSSRGITAFDDTASQYSGMDDGASVYDDTESRYESEFEFESLPPLAVAHVEAAAKKRDIEMGQVNPRDDTDGETLIEEEETSSARRKWVCCTWMLTWWAWPCCLSWCGGMRRKDIQMAWREKVALCITIFLLCCALLFFIIGLGRLICPRVNVLAVEELAGRTKADDPWAYAYGRAYQIKDIVQQHQNMNVPDYLMEELYGQDVAFLFDKHTAFNRYCSGNGISAPPPNWDNLPNRRPIRFDWHMHNNTQTQNGVTEVKPYFEFMNQYARSRVGWTMDFIKQNGSPEKRILVINNNVYDVSAYFNGKFFTADEANFDVLFNNYGRDATEEWNRLFKSRNEEQAKIYMNCMNNMFYIGVVDDRNNFQCRFSNYILLASTVVIVAVIAVKFLAALQFGSRKEPEDHDKFVICQVPCYTEGAESLQKTLESLARLTYDDKRKLLLVICDGMIIGSGNDRPTPRIVLDILGVDPSVDPEPLSFQSLGEGDRQHNMGKVYSGLYEVHGHSVPFIVVVKVGQPTEHSRPGNRGKRDSQMVLMRFLNRVHFNSEMNPLELELYHHMKNIIGVNPSFYEYILMVDADTEVEKDSMNRMVSAMIHDSKIMGICGETLLANEKDSWATMIQVYEYFISHHLAKAFESLFGSVTCLPGCFCMYRVRSPTKNIPLLIAPAMISDYAENRVDTLHMKNLLHLGEDRYLTTLMMKHFPHFKTCFINDARCHTNAPDRWSVLLSQRRRWINSTVHNLLELMFLPQLCGFCLFSMRFVVMLDLFSTFVQPVVVIYIGYLIYSVIAEPDLFPLMSVILIAAIYGFQVFIFIVKRQWAQIGWMIVYILAMPIFSFYIPIYAFWHFDDFSWGNTRVVIGDKGQKKIYAADVKPFNPKSISLKKWSDHEAENWEKTSEVSGGSHGSGYTHSHHPHAAAASAYGSQYAPSAYGGAASVYGATTSPSVYSGYAGPSRPGYAGSAYGAPVNAPPHLPNPRRSSGISLGSFGGGFAAGVSGLPSDDEILREVRRILATGDLMTITKKQVRDELGAVFGVDLTPKKAVINQFIEEILHGRL
ncbi:hypothetical protein HDU85_006587 [Gaertneriomyces sp. JEL0708]|nr:hypothetical protein HDU85_006587 [Gaertneriomyces sp. JEL0708]